MKATVKFSPAPIENVTLELSSQEAKLLLCLMGSVGLNNVKYKILLREMYLELLDSMKIDNNKVLKSVIEGKELSFNKDSPLLQ